MVYELYGLTVDEIKIMEDVVILWVPDFQGIMLPLLKFASDKKEHN